MIVCGYALTFILFNVFPILMPMGPMMIVGGVIFLGRSKRPKSNDASKNVKITTTTSNNDAKIKQQINVIRDRCEKSFDHVRIDNSPSAEIERDTKDKDSYGICSRCGSDLLNDNAHVIDDALLCHSCFSEKHKNVDPCEIDENGMNVDDAVKSLRSRIIAEITKNPGVKYQLASLLWQDAADCFPNCRFRCDGAWFNLDLQTGKLSANVGTYPNQFGASYEDSFSLSSAEFGRIARRFNMSKELQAFKSDEDWSMLFDERLNAAASAAYAALQKREEEHKRGEAEKHAIKIPVKYSALSPDMCLSEITIELTQRYCERSINVSVVDGNYLIVFLSNSRMSSSCKRYTRALSAAEAVWLEKKASGVIGDPDESTWQSIPGGDTMNVIIKRNNGQDISFFGVKPFRKYSDLQYELEYLAQYGSVTVEK